MISSILPYVQITVSVLLIASILLQQRGTGLGSAFGGGDGGGANPARRGMEKILFNTTIILAVLFLISAFLSLWV